MQTIHKNLRLFIFFISTVVIMLSVQCTTKNERAADECNKIKVLSFYILQGGHDA